MLGVREQEALLKVADNPILDVLFRDALAYRKSHCLASLTGDVVNRSGIRDVVELPSHLYGLKYELDFLLEKKPILRAEDGNVMLAKVFCYGEKWMKQHGEKLRPLEVGMIPRESHQVQQLMLGGPTEILQEFRQMREMFSEIKARVSGRTSVKVSALHSPAGSDEED
jgi:hypothetical protein